ncbi:hypothetical protein [Marinitenerispora sediminis]|uniref:Chaplin n=1 Tax=Marinitenerispora sediminis TaxID=1931232 RepID=A0A368T440_9ACTN|nr:hypothetical protein [Marinitenerispora sediminis]RCV52771.1 hypothetical protein DEF24_21540 [Marinitenerispora sediminis]RCV55590.1 hypothetical protein DEF28_05710 [Marinitenerispora sediminis]RCV61918.1 hypothetical protein DEF23_01150 [Marinitenerispora sediminis]
MLKKLTAFGLVAGAAMGALLTAAPAQAHGWDVNASEQQYNQNLQVVPVQVCNANVGVLAIVVPVLSPQTTGDCVNGPQGTNVDFR